MADLNLDKTHYKMLLKARRTVLFSYDLTNPEEDICDYLSDCGYFYCDTLNIKRGNHNNSSTKAYTLTESGKAATHEFRYRYMLWWIPVIISIGAAIASIIAVFR